MVVWFLAQGNNRAMMGLNSSLHRKLINYKCYVLTTEQPSLFGRWIFEIESLQDWSVIKLCCLDYQMFHKLSEWVWNREWFPKRKLNQKKYSHTVLQYQKQNKTGNLHVESSEIALILPWFHNLPIAIITCSSIDSFDWCLMCGTASTNHSTTASTMVTPCKLSMNKAMNGSVDLQLYFQHQLENLSLYQVIIKQTLLQIIALRMSCIEISVLKYM